MKVGGLVSLPLLCAALLAVTRVQALPVGAKVQTKAFVSPRAMERHLEVHGHRGGRGEANEETLAAYADAFLAGATHLEWDVGITSDGVPVAWHDENIQAAKCLDPPSGDHVVGKYIANVTLSQIKSLDCGAQRLGSDFMLQQTRKGARIQTLDQVFTFAQCVDAGLSAAKKIRFNIESKLSPPTPNTTVGPQVFVDRMYAAFRKHGVVDRVVFQSFDWRTLQLMGEQHPEVVLSALVSSDASYLEPIWLGGIDLNQQPGSTLAQRIVHAAKSINATYLSPNHNLNGTEVNQPGYAPFVDTDMVRAAHDVDMKVIPYTPDSLDTAEKLVYTDGVDGLITDYPTTFTAWARSRGFQLPQKRDVVRVQRCLKEARARDDEP